MKAKSTLIACALALATAGCGGGREAFSASATLVEDGVAKCRVVVGENASRPEKFGASEISKYFDKATGCGALTGGCEIAVSVEALPELKGDGFVMDVAPDRVKIVGATPRGALYGCYELLKEYAGMRWLVPGEDGEYCVLGGRTIRVPLGRVVRNPYLRVRETRTTGDEGYLWSARNNMQCEVGLHRFTLPNGKRTRDADRLEELAVGGIGPCGHVMSTLLLWGAGDEKDKPEVKARKLFAVHPEWFPLIKGERKLIWGANDPNPCISNVALLDHMAEVVCKWIDRPHGRDGYMIMGNNDTTIWCQCDKCRALDAPERNGTKGEISDRYWYMVGEISRRVWRKFPDAKFAGWAYQNYWYPPVRTKIDPRLKVFVSFNNQCWRHAILDEKCTINSEMRKIYGMWRETRHPFVVNRDEIACSGNPGSDFLPSESVLAQNLRDYARIGCAGSHFCVGGPFPRTVSWERNSPPFYGENDRWYAMWQTCYLSARLEWDPARDYAAMYEEANRLWYGAAAWNGAMREFRRNLEKAFFETPGCIGWGSGAPLGRCLDQAGMEQKLKGLLDKAVAIAKADPDPRSLAHVSKEKSIFEKTWLAQRKIYLDNFKELNVYRKTGEIAVDGVLDEADWRNADVLTNFKAPHWGKVKTEDLQQTFVRAVYEQDYLYLAVEAMEPAMDKAVAGANVDRDKGYDVLGNHVELFYSYPDMAERCFQLMLNSEGQMYDLFKRSVADFDTSFRTKAKWAVKKGADRWTVEIAIPTDEIGMKCFDGATWKLNVARQREVEGCARESSSCCNGEFYAPATFVNMKFTPSRAKGIGQGRDTAPWQNAGFESHKTNAKLHKNFQWRRWKSEEVPSAWSGRDTPGEYIEENGNHYVRLYGDRQTDVSQYFLGPGKGRLKVSFRARGKGRITVWTGNYVDYTTGKPGYRIVDGTSENHTFELGEEWKVYTFEVAKLGLATERVAQRIRMAEGSQADVDDFYVTPMFE